MKMDSFFWEIKDDLIVCEMDENLIFISGKKTSISYLVKLARLALACPGLGTAQPQLFVVVGMI